MSILEIQFNPPKRPYSTNELNDMKERLYRNLKLNKSIFAHHDCGHFYLVRLNGKKEKDIISFNKHGNCSVCWKLKNTKTDIIHLAQDVVHSFYDTFHNPISFELVDLHSVFYKWLYL